MPFPRFLEKQTENQTLFCGIITALTGVIWKMAIFGSIWKPSPTWANYVIDSGSRDLFFCTDCQQKGRRDMNSLDSITCCWEWRNFPIPFRSLEGSHHWLSRSSKIERVCPCHTTPHFPVSVLCPVLTASGFLPYIIPPWILHLVFLHCL